jgi:hypothetical protein
MNTLGAQAMMPPTISQIPKVHEKFHKIIASNLYLNACTGAPPGQRANGEHCS